MPQNPLVCPQVPTIFLLAETARFDIQDSCLHTIAEWNLENIKFARQEALDKVGGRVRCFKAFGSVLSAANGKILAAHLEPDGYSVEIEWDIPRGPEPHRTRVSKSEFEGFLIEI